MEDRNATAPTSNLEAELISSAFFHPTPVANPFPTLSHGTFHIIPSAYVVVVRTRTELLVLSSLRRDT